MSILSDFIQAYDQAPEAEKDKFIEIIMPKVEKTPAFERRVRSIVGAILDESFEARLLTSELRPIKRIAKLEAVTGLEECYDEDDEHEPTIPERIQDIEEKLSGVNIGTTENPAIEIIQKTKTGKRAVRLIKALMASKKGHLTRTQIKEVLSGEDLGEARITENSSNPRRDIIDALNEAGKICSKVRLDKKTYGRHEWRLLKS